MTDDAPMEPVDWQSEPALYSYFQQGNISFNSAFQLKIRNTSHRPLWVSMLYLGARFGINNVLLSRTRTKDSQCARSHFRLKMNS